MNSKPFRLTPFPTGESLPELEITGAIGREADVLSLSCKVVGETADLILPAPAEKPLRRDNLWQTTCFELFLAEEGAANYREFNLSPSGHWNVYSFAGYRKNMLEEPAYSSLPFTIHKERRELSITIGLQLEEIVDGEKNLEAAACAVIRSVRHGLSYWALTHCGPQPDFHRRESFLIKL